MNVRRIAYLFISILFLSGSLKTGYIKTAMSQDDTFIDKLERDSFEYFINEMNPENGLMKDSSRPGAPSSVAVVGFGITALCVAESRGWISRDKAYKRILQILYNFNYKFPHKNGFFYHFLDMRTGKRAWNSEISSIDTAILLSGALFAGEYFKGTDVERLALRLYRRVNWKWMLNGKDTLCMGWKPESGFLWYYWDSYSEASILYVLAIGSPTYPISADSWKAWKRTKGNYKGYDVVYSYFGSIFTYQYSHAWIDFRGLKDNELDYFDNSVKATLANKQFCIDKQDEYKGYGDDSWGLTACLGPYGYKGYGAKPGLAKNDGTISPCGMAGSIVFTPEEAIKGLKYIYEQHKEFIYGQYGFKDAFNLDKNWWAEEYLGIDVGITLLMIENYRTGLIWKKFMNLECVNNWINECFGN